MRKIAFLAIFSWLGLSLRHPAAGFAVPAGRNAGLALEGERQRHVGVQLFSNHAISCIDSYIITMRYCSIYYLRISVL